MQSLKQTRVEAETAEMKQLHSLVESTALNGVSEKAASSASSPTSEVKSQINDAPGTWSALCHWLAQQGLVVFVNAIAPDLGWQWSWGGHSEAGYADAIAAITAALQYQLMFVVPYLPTYPPSASLAVPAQEA